MIFWCLHLRQRSSLQEETASFDKRVVHRKTDCASEISSGEMFAGGEDIVRSLPPAKPRWSELIVFWYLLLRQSRSSQEETASSGKRVGHRKIDSAGEINSGERMFAGGEGIVRGYTSAKPQWSEVIIYWYLLLRQNSPYRRKLPAPMSGALIGCGDVPAISAPGRECSSEERAWCEAILRRSRSGRR